MQAACWCLLGLTFGLEVATGLIPICIPSLYRAPSSCSCDSLTPICHSLSWIRLPAWPGWWVILEKVLLGSAFPCQLSREVTGPGKGNGDWGVGVCLEPRERESHFSSGPCVSWVWTELSWIELCLVE